HTAHHTPTELNIAPLLDLAFVLLVIFIITTTPIVNDLDLDLPNASKHAKDPPRQANYITVKANGTIWFKKKGENLPGLHQALLDLSFADPDLSVIIRGDSKAKNRSIPAVLDAF